MSETVRVMAFHDSTTIVAVIAVQVKVCNFEVAATAPSGQETLAKYQKHQPTLVLLDLVMPEMTGSETRQKLLEADKAVCVVMVNSMGTKETVQDFLKKGANSCLQTPLMKGTMLAISNNVCQEAAVAL